MVVLAAAGEGLAGGPVARGGPGLPGRARQGRHRDRLRSCSARTSARGSRPTRSAGATWAAAARRGRGRADDRGRRRPGAAGAGRVGRRLDGASSPSSTPTARTSAASLRRADRSNRAAAGLSQDHSQSPVASTSPARRRYGRGADRDGLRCGTISAMRGRLSSAEVSTVTSETSTKWVYDFSEGSKDQKDLLGGKGANLAEMTNLGPARPARLHDHHRRLPLLPGARRHARRSSTPRSPSTWPRSRRPWARPSATRPTRCWCRCAPGPRRRCPG